MKRNEQMILGGLAAVGLIAAFWLLMLSPKRNEAAQLKDDIDQLHSSLTQAQEQVAAGQDARKSYAIDYRRMVVLGKAVPADSEQTSLLVQLQTLADRSGVEFQSLDLGDASSSSTTASIPSSSTSSTSTTPTDSSSTTSTDSSSSTTSTDSSSTDTSNLATASEASVSTLPIGAAVGPAGLPVMPYDLTFTGGFNQIADFMKRLDGLVHVRGELAHVRGRLLTMDGFTLTPVDTATSPHDPELTADLSVTTFLTPSDQGVTAGATPTGPGATTATLTSSSTPADTASPSSSTSSTSTGTSTAP